jgi:hypothetical protein
MPEVEWSTDLSCASWIRERLAPFGSGGLTSVVPAGFAAYARLLHPAHGSEDHPVRWLEVAARNGLDLHAGTQFPDISLLPPTGDEAQMWDGVGPVEGTLSEADAVALVDVLRRHTAASERCCFGLWDGYGWDAGGRMDLSYTRDDEPPEWAEPAVYEGQAPIGHRTAESGAPADPVPREVRDGLRVELPNRSYFLYRGPVEQALAFVASKQQTPNLWWPADRSWCVATEIDLDCTYVGGSEELVDDIVGDGRLEAFRADPAERHHMRTPAWLTAAIDDAVTRLVAGQPARVETSQGTVSARLRRPRRLRHGYLRITSVRPGHGSHRSNSTRLSHRSDEVLDKELRSQLTWAVLDLLG